MKKLSYIKKIVSVILALLLFTLAPMSAIADSLSDLSSTLTTLKVETAADYTLQFKTPSGVDATETVIITFATSSGYGFNIASLATTSIDLAEATDTSDCDSATYSDETLGGASASGIWGVATSGQAITFTAPTDAGATAGRCLQIEVGSNADNQDTGSTDVINPQSAGSYTIAYTGTFGDTGTSTVEILTDDQVQLSAEVVQSISFSITHSSASFGNLSASQVKYASSTGQTSETWAHQLVAGTNANTGYTITASGTTLTSGGNTITPMGTAAASSQGSEQFGMKITDDSAGSGGAVAPYNGTTYVFNATTTDQVASSGTASVDTTYSIYYLANIASNTEAGTYTSTITFIATANY